jgi:UDP-2,3-diacylglucosamine pyrophosphatase LpxH
VKRTWIAGDVHLGSPFCRHDEFIAFLEGLPDGDALVLNGDIVDNCRDSLPDRRKAGLRAVRAASAIRPVTWLAGNNDRRYRLPDAPAINYAEETVVAGGVLVCHGDRFEPTFRRNPFLVVPVKAMYWAYRNLYGRPVHPAAFAKLLRVAYRAFTNHVATAACEEARRRGLAAIVCGHTHMAEERTGGGVRYVNTGCWTELDCFCAAADSGAVTLVPAGSARSAPGCGAGPKP